MPPWQGVAGQMVLSYFAPGAPAQHNAFGTWDAMGRWYWDLAQGRGAASQNIKEKVAVLTANLNTPLEKMQALAQFLQSDIRYVAVELGIGGWQPHPAADIFEHRYGDCKDKATLLISMLQQIGVHAYYVIINTHRDAITGDQPAHTGFNHAIVAIQLPRDSNDASLVATIENAKLGRILFFDPTDEITPFGHIRGQLQANYGLLVTAEGGELLQLPRQAPELNGLERTGKLVLDENGNLRGTVTERATGDLASAERARLRYATAESEKLKRLESLLSDSLGTFQLTDARFANVSQTNQPLGLDYSFQAPGYAKYAGDMLLVRPRVVGSKSSGILETDKPRMFPIEYGSPALETDNFEIALPPGYDAVDLPPPVNVEFSFGSYHSKAEVTANVLRYARSFEFKDVTIPAGKANDLKKFYRIIATDERGTVVLKRRVQAQETPALSAH